MVGGGWLVGVGGCWWVLVGVWWVLVGVGGCWWVVVGGGGGAAENAGIDTPRRSQARFLHVVSRKSAVPGSKAQ